LNRVQEFPLLMEVLLSEKSRVYWSSYRPDKAYIAFTVPGQVNNKRMALPELLQYLNKRYGVTETHPQVAQVVEWVHAEVARQQAEHAAEEAQKQAEMERYEQLYAPFQGLDRAALIDEIHCLRNGEEGVLFKRILEAKDAEIDRLEAEVADLEAKIEAHDREVSDMEWKRDEAYRFVQQVLKENEVLSEAVASLRAKVEAHREVDAHDDHECHNQVGLNKHEVAHMISDIAENLGETAKAAMNDQHSPVGEVVE
jgi:DNA repair exonuclease SbcCD ATPase subunit